MLRRYVPAVFVLLGLVVPGNAKASVFGEENATLSALLFQALKQYEQMLNFVRLSKDTLRATNEGLSIARQAYSEMKMLSNYSLEDLMSDARAGMLEAFPEMRDVFYEGGLLKDQWDNKENFMSYRNHWDDSTRQKLEAVMRHSYRSAIWTKAFPDAFNGSGLVNPVNTEIYMRYKQSGMEREYALKTTAIATLVDDIEKITKTAEKSQNVEAKAAAATAEAAVGIYKEMSEFNDLAKMDAAEKSAEMRQRKVLHESNKNTFSPNFVKDRLSPGGGLKDDSPKY